MSQLCDQVESEGEWSLVTAALSETKEEGGTEMKRGIPPDRAITELSPHLLLYECRQIDRDLIKEARVVLVVGQTGISKCDVHLPALF